MATCRHCGKEYSLLYARATEPGMCNRCWLAWLQKPPEEREQTGEEPPQLEMKGAAATLLELFTKHVPGENPKILGAACWKSIGTAFHSLLGTYLLSSLLGFLGFLLRSSERRVGIVAVTDTQLFLVDLGTVFGDVTPEKLSKAVGRVSVKKALLKELTAEWEAVDDGYLLKVEGALKIKASFPRSFLGSNPAKATVIGAVIRGAS